MQWLAKFGLLLLLAWNSYQADFNWTPQSPLSREDISKEWNPHVINNASCPKFVLASLGGGGLGDQLEHYLYYMYLAKLLDATLVVDGFVSGNNLAGGLHSGSNEYGWIAEHLFGISMKFNATYVRSVYQPATISLKYDDVTTAKSKEIAGGPTASSVLLPCNHMASSSIYDCGGWCFLTRPFVGFTEIGWMLRQNQGYEKCRRHYAESNVTASTSATDSNSEVVKVVCLAHPLMTDHSEHTLLSHITSTHPLITPLQCRQLGMMSCRHVMSCLPSLLRLLDSLQDHSRCT